VSHRSARYSNSDAESAGGRLAAATQKDAENCNTQWGRLHLARAVKKGGTTSGRVGPPEVVPVSKARRTAGVPSGRFLRSSARSP
jgi:hypothetical protein